MKNVAISLLCLFCISCPALAQSDAPDVEVAPDKPGMTQTRMKQIISEIAEDVTGEDNSMSFYYNGANLALISDANANRMRIIAPVIAAKDLTEEQVLSTLVSNYHLALDARYAIGEDVLYSAFIHPLRELTEEQLISAVRQVATLRNTFGTGYTSGEMLFGVDIQDVEQEQIDL